MTQPARTAPRNRGDLCPGILRPWPADDGALVRVRLVGGEISVGSLRALSQVAREHGDGNLHLTSRANLQVRGLPAVGGTTHPEVVAAVRAAGLLPHPRHDLVRNVMVSPLTGIVGGRADLRPLAREYDALLCADPGLSALPGKFLVVLDDGRGDLFDHGLDLGAMAVDGRHAQLRAGAGRWGDVEPLDDVPRRLVDLARRFVELRGEGPMAAWHVDELPPAALDALGLGGVRDPRTEVHGAPLPFGAFAGGVHREVPAGVLTAELADAVVEAAVTETVIVTPWHGIVLPSR